MIKFMPVVLAPAGPHLQLWGDHLMRMNRTLMASGLAAAVLLTGSPAFADEPTPESTESAVVETAPPAAPEESDLVEDAPAIDAPAPPVEADSGDGLGVPRPPKPSDFPHAPACVPHWKYTATSKTKDYHKGVGSEQANYNGTSQSARSMFTSEVTGSVGVAFSGEVGVKASAVVAEVEAKFGIELAVSLTAKLGNTISVPTPPKKTTFARYGVYRLKSAGYSQYTYQNCTKGTKKNVTVYTPRRVGWAIWEK
ncbi:hypothetical protein [Streptomyces lichenis]|uniref:Uncharacterized protein n=1 Tax=Streptomyces lichenis TaxID=2306967 RepID=A0ABT0I5Y6_9ACTN|nr:hypothetical protein [Streptomyces lichenis]MCK8676731.1 hypothetical protein [Streptomyces lichenis]